MPPQESAIAAPGMDVGATAPNAVQEEVQVRYHTIFMHVHMLVHVAFLCLSVSLLYCDDGTSTLVPTAHEHFVSPPLRMSACLHDV
jgi:hypothetical protein